MIHIFIGTKAQFIKMAPVMMEMNRRGMPYHLIETGQHAALTADLIGQFGLQGSRYAPAHRLNEHRNDWPGGPLDIEDTSPPPIVAGKHHGENFPRREKGGLPHPR